MERINGHPIAHGWLARNAGSKAKVLSQLKGMIQDMRSITPPGPGVTNVDGGPLFDYRLPGPVPFGPFTSIYAFHNHLHQGLEPSQVPPTAPSAVIEMIRLHNGVWPPTVFTHGDLSSLNILVRGDDVVGIIDWTTAGWYPSYWEYTSACQVHLFYSFWREEIDKFLDTMPEELAMEETRRRYFGDY